MNEEWARGELGDRSGIFPLNFVEVIEDRPTSGTNVLSEYREYDFSLCLFIVQIKQIIG